MRTQNTASQKEGNFKREWTILAFIIIGIVGITLWAKHNNKSETLTPEQKNERAAMQRLTRHFNSDGSHIGLVKWVKDNMHNPKSFEHVETKYLEKDDKITLWMTYRGTNRFGGIITSKQIAIADYDGNIIFAE
jgi:hypothetical protein